MKDVLNDFKSCCRPMTKNEIKIKQLEEDLEAEKSISSNLARRILKAIKLLEEDYFEDGSGNNVEEVIKILKGEENE